MLFDRSGRKSHYPGAESHRKTLLLYRASPLLSRTNWRAQANLTVARRGPSARSEAPRLVWLTPRDKLGCCLPMSRIRRKKRLADAYKELTGEDLDSRLAAGGLSRDYSPRINGILYAE